jgi:hypothetical protein
MPISLDLVPELVSGLVTEFLAPAPLKLIEVLVTNLGAAV